MTIHDAGKTVSAIPGPGHSSPHETRTERSERLSKQEVRLVPRDRIKCCTVLGVLSPETLNASPDAASVRSMIEDNVIEQVGREIAAALLANGKIWFQHKEGGHFFAAVEIIVPEMTIGEKP